MATRRRKKKSEIQKPLDQLLGLVPTPSQTFQIFQDGLHSPEEMARDQGHVPISMPSYDEATKKAMSEAAKQYQEILKKGWGTYNTNTAAPNSITSGPIYTNNTLPTSTYQGTWITAGNSTWGPSPSYAPFLVKNDTDAFYVWALKTSSPDTTLKKVIDESMVIGGPFDSEYGADEFIGERSEMAENSGFTLHTVAVRIPVNQTGADFVDDLEAYRSWREAEALSKK